MSNRDVRGGAGGLTREQEELLASAMGMDALLEANRLLNKARNITSGLAPKLVTVGPVSELQFIAQTATLVGAKLNQLLVELMARGAKGKPDGQQGTVQA
jgi:hypothetical protein